MNPINIILDTVMQIEREDGYQRTPETLETLQKYIDKYEGSNIDMVVVADRLKTIAEELLDKFKEDAWWEAKMTGNDSKFTHKGNALTPVESHFKYNYPEDTYIDKVTDQLAPVLKKKKTLEDSIKARQKELVEDGKAELTGSSKYLKIDKK
jgi:hypothetical protein